MSWEELLLQLWNVLNEPLSILLLGSGAGWLFVKLVWEPFKHREAEEKQRQVTRREAEIRLFSIGCAIENGYLVRRSNVHGGSDAEALDPAYKEWSLRGLIFAGWDRNHLRKCLPHMDRLILGEEARRDPEKVRATLHGLQAIREALSLPGL